MKQENREKGATPLHGTGGELNVAPLRTLNPLTRAFLSAAEETQFPSNDDFNGAAQDGFGPWEVTQKNGQRWNSARAFLHPVLKRSNLEVLYDTETLRIVFSGTRATGVAVRRNGVESLITARGGVLLSSGATTHKTADAVRRGRWGRMAKLGVATVRRAGRRQNLQDHPAAWNQERDVSGKARAAPGPPRYLGAINIFSRGGDR